MVELSKFAKPNLQTYPRISKDYEAKGLENYWAELVKTAELNNTRIVQETERLSNTISQWALLTPSIISGSNPMPTSSTVSIALGSVSNGTLLISNPITTNIGGIFRFRTGNINGVSYGTSTTVSASTATTFFSVWSRASDNSLQLINAGTSTNVYYTVIR